MCWRVFVLSKWEVRRCAHLLKCWSDQKFSLAVCNSSMQTAPSKQLHASTSRLYKHVALILSTSHAGHLFS